MFEIPPVLTLATRDTIEAKRNLSIYAIDAPSRMKLHTVSCMQINGQECNNAFNITR